MAFMDLHGPSWTFMDLHGPSLLYMWHHLRLFRHWISTIKTPRGGTWLRHTHYPLVIWLTEPVKPSRAIVNEWLLLDDGRVPWWHCYVEALQINLLWTVMRTSSKEVWRQLAFRDTDSQKHFATGYRNWPHHQSGNISCWIQFSVWTQIDFIASLQILRNQDWSCLNVLISLWLRAGCPKSRAQALPSWSLSDIPSAKLIAILWILSHDC